MNHDLKTSQHKQLFLNSNNFIIKCRNKRTQLGKSKNLKSFGRDNDPSIFSSQLRKNQLEISTRRESFR